jgi:hypothetical protein
MNQRRNEEGLFDQFSLVLYLTKQSWKAESNQSNVIEVEGQAGEMEHKITDLEMTNKLIFHIDQEVTKSLK